MDLYPIILGISRPGSATAKLKARKNKKNRAGSSGSASSSRSGKFIDGKPEKLPADLKNKILERDQKTCRFCGFMSDKYQDIVARNGDPLDWREQNLVTSCVFCHQCFHLETVRPMESGALIWLPEISQAALHNISRAIYVGRISQGPIAETAKKTHEILLERREEAEKRIGTHSPAILATVLKDYLTPKYYGLRDKKLEGIRLLPLDRRLVKEADLEFNQFPQILAYWRSPKGPYGQNKPPEWPGLYQKILSAA